jgi:UDP-N-acetylmuramyl pentapeptide synthase
MDLNRLASAIGAANAPSAEILDLAYDTRRVAAGSLFFCVPGANVDGHDLAADAVERRGGTRRRAAPRGQSLIHN